MNNLLDKAFTTANSLIKFDKDVVNSMKFLSSSWEELGFQRLDDIHSFFADIFDDLEFLPIKDESLYSEKFLKELREKEQWLKENYKEEIQEIGRRLEEKLKAMLKEDD